ncbi:MAG: CSLREA domain-containing protein [Moorea sp. SIO4A3]|nr:CSLREA domain-containing protein [Moorena sp. SIO4A3]
MAVLTVNTTADEINPNDGITSLREAIETANNSPGEDTILFELEPDEQTITLELILGTLEITDSVTIVGEDADQITSNTFFGEDADQITVEGDGGSFDIFTISNGANVTVTNLTISEGEDGIQVNDGNLEVIDSILTGNDSDGIDIQGNNTNLNVLASSFTNNRSDGLHIDGDNSTVLVRNSTLSENQGQGIDVNAAGQNVRVVGSTISKNQESGIKIGSKGENPFEDFIANDNFVQIFNSRIIDNVTGGNGGGVNVLGYYNDVLLVNNQISRNSAEVNGGGIFVDEANTIYLFNNKITYNIADSNNDGIGYGGGLSITPPAFFLNGPTVVIRGTEITNNINRNGLFFGSNIAGKFINFGGNEIGNRFLSNYTELIA